MTELKLKFGAGFAKRATAIAMAVMLGVSMLPVTTFGSQSGREGTTGSGGEKDVTLADLIVDPSEKEIEVGGEVTLTAKFADIPDVSKGDVTAGDVSKVKWSSSNNDVATVNNGIVKGVAAGTATITATYEEVRTATCKITVKAKEGGETPTPPATVTVKSISLDKATLSLKKGEKATLKATTDPANQKVTWTSSAPNVAKVTDGTVEAVAKGTATITAKAGDKTAACTVTVEEADQTQTPSETVTVTSLKLNKTKLTLAKGQSSTLKATVAPAGAKLEWSTSNKKVATVSNGKVKAVKKGTATITVKAGDKTATCKVTVKNPSVTLSAKSATLQVKKSTTAIKVVEKFPSNDKVKSWKSSNTKIVKVDKKGKITAQKKTGKAKVTVTMKSGAKATCTITVQKGKVKTKSLKLDKKKATLKKGKSITLKVTRNPVTATEKLKWSSSNKKVATVNSKGKVTAKKKGKATITVKSSNGKKATCKITVK